MTRRCSHSLDSREPERDVVLRDLRDRRVHVRAQRDADHRAFAAQADRRRPAARRDPLDDCPDPAVRRCRARRAGLHHRPGARRAAVGRRLSRDARLSRVCVPGRQRSDRDVAECRARRRRRAAAAVVGVLWPLRDVSARSPQAGPPRRIAGGWIVDSTSGRASLCIALTTVILSLRPREAFIGIVSLVVALVCLLPLLFDGLVALFERVQRPVTGRRPCSRSPSCRRRRHGCARWRSPRPRRSRSSASSQSRAAAQPHSMVWTPPHARLTPAPMYGSRRGGIESAADNPVQADRAGSLGGLPGVSSVGAISRQLSGLGRSSALGSWAASEHRPADPTEPDHERQSALASPRVRQGGWAVLSQALASEHHLHVGQAFILPAPRPMSLRVAALSTNLDGRQARSSSAPVTTRGPGQSGDPSAYEIQAKPAFRRDRASRVPRASGRGPDSRSKPSTERQQRHYALAAQGLSRLTQIRLLVLIAAVLAVAGAMGSMVWQRRDLVAFIKVEVTAEACCGDGCYARARCCSWPAA